MFNRIAFAAWVSALLNKKKYEKTLKQEGSTITLTLDFKCLAIEIEAQKEHSEQIPLEEHENWIIGLTYNNNGSTADASSERQEHIMLKLGRYNCIVRKIINISDRFNYNMSNKILKQ